MLTGKAGPASLQSLPVVVFQHGYTLHTDFYLDLFTRVASHGYIVAAPQVTGQL